MTKKKSPLAEIKPVELFAKHDPKIILAGLFKVRGKGKLEEVRVAHHQNGKTIYQTKRKRPSFEYIYHYDTEAEENCLHFKCYEVLNEKDMVVLAGLAAIASAGLCEVVPIDSDKQTLPQREAMKHLGHINLKFREEEKRVPLCVKTSLREIAKQTGQSLGGSSLQLIKDSIERMSNVGVVWHVDGAEVSFNLLHYATTAQGEICVTFNAITAQAFAGGRRQYTRIDMADVRKLEQPERDENDKIIQGSPAAAILYQRLCAQVNPGGKGRFKLESLIEYVWDEEAEECGLTEAQLKRKRIDRLKHQKNSINEALEQIQRKLGWKCSCEANIHAETVYQVERPQAKVQAKAKTQAKVKT